ncbi:MAG: hypothetical protein J2P19_18865 [Pseudonocardia sp.]|nr:hypothetical protein [Pseudonocardia sp.]
MALGTAVALGGRAGPAPGADEPWVHHHLAELPGSIRADVESWIDALRGQGRRPSPPIAWVSIRTYPMFAEPALLAWAERYDSLRAVTSDDVEQALRDHSGRSPHNVHTALRSLFRGLKREGRVFADPARGITAHYARRLPRPLPLDRLRGLLDQVTGPRHRLVTALVAVHALSLEELRALRLADHDPVRCALDIDRAGLPFTLVLEEFVARLVTDWRRARAASWPHTRNPHVRIAHPDRYTPEPAMA